MKRNLHISVSFALALMLSLASACGSRTGSKTERNAAAEPTRPFPTITVPAAYTDDADRVKYAAEHFWDEYLAGKGVTDSACILGVARPEVEQSFSTYITILWQQPLPQAQKSVEGFFKKVCATQQRDSSSQFFTQFTQTAARYFYDPNSPMRDEDLWLPFVKGLAESPLTRDDMRTAYRYEASMCALCPRGSVAPDIKARRIDGSIFSLHGIKAKRTLLFFTNPGCPACQEIIDAINSELGSLVASGQLAVANIYVDEDYDAWKAYVGHYPREWYTGFDYSRAVREGRVYDVRAIPSVYLLGPDKTILLKDAPFERVLASLLQ